MTPAIRYGGWILSLVLLAVCGYFYMEMVESRALGVAAEKAALEQRAVAVERAEMAEANAASAGEELKRLRQELDTLKSGPDAGMIEAAPAPDSAPVEEAAAPEPEPEAVPADDAGEGDGAERGDRIANAQMAMMAEMTYQDLFNDLQLTPEVRATLKEAIAASMADVATAGQEAMRAKKEKAKDVHARLEAMEAELRNELSGTLSPEELAAWDEYEPVADQILYERLVDGQLNMLATGLSGENRIVASQVVAEELVRELDIFNASDEVYSLDNFNNAQARALNASLERLNGTLEADQYGQVEGFVNQALTMFEAMAEQEGGK